ncbi:MAG: CrcB family protein [Propioniciclava sp.]|jgi:CrcB protein
MTWLWVMLAGGVGSVLRYLLVLGHEAFLRSRRRPVSVDDETLPTVTGTFVVNVVGALVMGVVIAATGAMEAQPVLTTGLLGGFTTFSAASLETARDWRAGRRLRGILVPVAMMVACVLAFWVGLMAPGPAVCAVAAGSPVCTLFVR